MLNRRQFLGTVSMSLLAAPIAAGAQPTEKVWRIGLVSVGTDPARPVRWQPFVETMRELGYVEGRNFAVKTAFAKGRAVATLARPGGNVTGLSTLSPETSGKRVELLARPLSARFDALGNPGRVRSRFAVRREVVSWTAPAARDARLTAAVSFTTLSATKGG
jgi:hypothetical protein